MDRAGVGGISEFVLTACPLRLFDDLTRNKEQVLPSKKYAELFKIITYLM